jgi:hypothetical protein
MVRFGGSGPDKGEQMKTMKRKLAASLLAFGLVGGAGIAMAAPAHAVVEQRETYSGYATKARCQSVQTSVFQRLAATGKERTAYTPCHYQDAKRKWMFQVWYI